MRCSKLACWFGLVCWVLFVCLLYFVWGFFVLLCSLIWPSRIKQVKELWLSWDSRLSGFSCTQANLAVNSNLVQSVSRPGKSHFGEEAVPIPQPLKIAAKIRWWPLARERKHFSLFCNISKSHTFRSLYKTFIHWRKNIDPPIHLWTKSWELRHRDDFFLGLKNIKEMCIISLYPLMSV